MHSRLLAPARIDKIRKEAATNLEALHPPAWRSPTHSQVLLSALVLVILSLK
jgi:hypothetical protein